MTSPNQQTSWGPKPVLFVAGLLVVAIAVIWALLSLAPVDRLVAWFFAAVAAIGTGTALMMRQRLTAGPAGLVVAGPFGRTTIDWSQVTRIEMVNRSRLGLSSTALEIDLDDDGLLVFGKTDLGADPEQVAEELRRIKPPGR